MKKEDLEKLLEAMKEHGISGFWIQLVADQGPRGKQIGQKLWDTMPEQYR